jgi:hypothetical protein
MARKTLATTLLDALASLRLAVVVILALAGTCAFATFYEMKHGTPAAQRDIYMTWWFALILALLGANIFFAMVKRYPFRSHHTGFVIAHVGILILLAGSLVSLHRGLDSNMAIVEGETTDRVALLEKALHVGLPNGHTHSFPVAFEKNPPRPGREKRFEAPGSGFVMVADAYERHVTGAETFVEGTDPNPVVRFALEAPFAKEAGFLVANDPSRSHLHMGPISLALHSAQDEAAARAEAAKLESPEQVLFVMAAGSGKLFYGSGAVKGAEVERGKPLATAFPGMRLVVTEALPNASVRRSIEPAPAPANESRQQSAVRVRLEGPQGRSEPQWVLFGETVRFEGPSGSAVVAYRPPEMALPFQVTLVRFRSEKYPGSSMAATYESFVRVDDPERGTSEHHISMNNPLHYRGYIFFQSSFVEGRPMMSIFSVARAPGLPLVYLGVTLIGVGVAWMFYIKPYLAKRKAALAAAASKRELTNDASSARFDPRPAGGSEPARSGA